MRSCLLREVKSAAPSEASQTSRLDIIWVTTPRRPSRHNSDDVRVRADTFLDDRAFLREARVFIAPLRFGAGIKGKVGEAMAHWHSSGYNLDWSGRVWTNRTNSP